MPRKSDATCGWGLSVFYLEREDLQELWEWNIETEKSMGKMVLPERFTLQELSEGVLRTAVEGQESEAWCSVLLLTTLPAGPFLSGSLLVKP